MDAAEPKNHFAAGIEDDVTFNSIDILKRSTLLRRLLPCKFFGLGSDGMVGVKNLSRSSALHRYVCLVAGFPL